MKGELVQQPLYRCCGCTDPSCKACRWSSKCLSNIHQARRGSAACKRGWNRKGQEHISSLPPLSTTDAVASAQPNSSSPTHLHLLSMEPWGHFVREAIIIKRHNSTYKYLASFTAHEAESAQSMRGMSTCEYVCVHAAARPRRLPFSIGGERQAARGELVTFHCHGNSLQVTLGKLNTAMAIYSRGLTPDETWRMSEQDGGGHARANTWVSCATKGLNLNTINNGHCCFLFIHVCITGLKVKKKWAAQPLCSCRPLILFNVFDISPLLFWYQRLLNFATPVALRRPKQSRLL